MRVLVIGCGGVGGVMAGNLARAGVDVSIVTGNASIAESINQRGLVVTEVDGRRWTARPRGGAHAEASHLAAPFDLAICATKITTLESALAAAAPALLPNAPVVVCQNGLPEAYAANVVGAERVVGCVVVWGASMSAPGEYLRTSRGALRLGRHVGGGADPALLVPILAAVSDVKIVPDLAAARWSKLAINCATSTLGAIGGQRLGPLLAQRFVRRLALELWSEVAEVAAAAGIRPAPVGGVDLMRMRLGPLERATPLAPSLAFKHALLWGLGLKYRRMRSSMLIALERGRTPEIDYLNGEVVKRGAALGVPTLTNARLVAAVHDLTQRKTSPSLDALRQVYHELRGASAATAPA